MLPYQPPSVSVSRRGHRGQGGDPRHTVVWARGEHDITTRVHLSATLAAASRFDDADLVVDLSGVTFMDASTVDALVVAGDGLRADSRSLHVRDPSPSAWRILNLCGLAGMIDDHQTPTAAPAPAAALGSWVDVPAEDPASDAVQPEVAREEAVVEPARAMAQSSAVPAELVRQRRAPS